MSTIIESDRSMVDTFRSVLGEGSEALTTLDQARRHLEARPQEYAVVLGPSVDLAAAASFAESMRVNRPSLSVILMRRRVDTSVLTEALRAGMREVIEDRDLQGLSTAAHRAYGLWKAMSNAGEGGAPTRRGKLVTVFGNKGGVGKSTLATNLATALVDEGDAQSVCLVDLDVAAGDVAIMLQLLPNTTLADLTSMESGLDPSSLQALLTTHSPGLSVLTAPLSPHATEHVSAETVGRALELLVTMFDVVVVDTSGDFDDFALQAFDHSDLVLLIGTLDIPALKSLKLAIETLDLLNLPRSRWRLVLNRADSKVGLSTNEVEQTLKMTITSAIPSSRDVPACINRGEAIVRAEPRHAVSQAVRQLAKHVLTADDTVSESSESAAEPRRGLLRRKVRQS